MTSSGIFWVLICGDVTVASVSGGGGGGWVTTKIELLVLPHASLFDFHPGLPVTLAGINPERFLTRERPAGVNRRGVVLGYRF